MTYEEKRMLVEAHREIRELRERYEAMCEVFEVLLNRKSGRPSQQEVAALEQARARMHGQTH